MTIAHPAPISPTTERTTRADRALRLFAERGEEIQDLGEELYEVPSSAGAGRGAYIVRYGGEVESCSCPGLEFGNVCKHLLCVGIAHARRRSGVKVVTALAVAAGDPFRAAARNGRGDLAALEERLAHELMDDAERQELRDRVLRARRRAR